MGFGPLILSIAFIVLYTLFGLSGLEFRYNPWASNKVIDVVLLKINLFLVH